MASSATATNVPFDQLVHRKTTLADATAAEDDPNNPWNEKPRSPRYFSLRSQARELPAAAIRQEFLELYQNNQVIILTGETGCGKTTQIPQYILYSDLPRLGGSQKIVCTQPRRVAAREVSARVANELDVELGQAVGYSFRDEELYSDDTRLFYKTDGRLLREMARDPMLRQYSCVIIDEAHERTESTDMLLGFLKALLRQRRDLKLVVMSATMRAHVFQKYLDGAPIFNIPGRTFPVEVLYSAGDARDEPTEEEGLKAIPDYVVAAIQVVLHLFRDAPDHPELDGDILIFVPGESDIRKIVAGLRHELRPDQMSIRALHAKMSRVEQQRALAPVAGEGADRLRRCIVATNVAETSLTIDGIIHVIDTGLQKGMSYNPRLRIWLLRVEPISQASAIQRAGRAGRTGPGMCWRLYSKSSYDDLLIKDPLPGLLRGDMAEPILHILSIGPDPRPDSVWTFDFIDRPSPEVMLRTWYDLQTLGCINTMGQITLDGKKTRRLPLEPRHALAIVKALQIEPFPVYEVAAIMTLLEEEEIFVRPLQLSEYADILHETFSSGHGDHFTLLNAWFAFKYHRNVAFKKLPPAEHQARLTRWCQEKYLSLDGLQSAARKFDGIVEFLRKATKFDAAPAPSEVLWTMEWAIAIKKALLSVSFTRIAVKDPRDEHTYRTLEEDAPAVVHPASIVARGHKYPFVIYDNFEDRGKAYFTRVTGIESQWLFAPNTVVGEYMTNLVKNPPERSGNWMAMKKLKLAYQRFEQLAALPSGRSSLDPNLLDQLEQLGL